MGLHPSHDTRVSDASTFDEICTRCGATDRLLGGWGRLAYPCPNAPKKEQESVMKPLVEQERLKGPDDEMWTASIRLDDKLFMAVGSTHDEAVENLRVHLRETVARGNAAQKILYFMTDAPPGTSNDGA